MKREEILEITGSVFREVFMDDSLQISLQSHAGEISGWDSMTHIELISAIENRFSIQFSFREIMNFNTVSDMIDMIEKHLQK
jgi:acyl carrier protein